MCCVAWSGDLAEQRDEGEGREMMIAWYTLLGLCLCAGRWTARVSVLYYGIERQAIEHLVTPTPPSAVASTARLAA